MTLIQNRFSHQIPVVDLLSTMQSVQINPTEMCNRTCAFCPRADSDLYKNKKEYISSQLCEIIGKQLNDINFKGRVGFVGFGEPLLHDSLIDMIRVIKQNAPSIQYIEVNTNGDFLTRNMLTNLHSAGLTHLTVSMYDKDDSEKFNNIAKNIPIILTLRHSYNIKNISMIDRIGIIKGNIKNINRECYIPFYKLFIDYNGDYLLCDQDWGRVSRKYNIKDVSIKDFWTDKLNSYRVNLIKGERYKNLPCAGCDINGTILGQDSFSYIKNIMLSSQ